MNPLEKSYDELNLAESYVKEMRSAKSLAEFEEAWKHFLSRLERAWYKFLAVYQKHPKFGYWGGQSRKSQKI